MTRESPISSGDAQEALSAVDATEANLERYNLRLHAVNALTILSWNALLATITSSSWFALADRLFGIWSIVPTIIFLTGMFFLFNTIKQYATPLRLREDWRFWVYVFAGTISTLVLLLSVRGIGEWPSGLTGLSLFVSYCIQGMTVAILIFCGRAFGVIGAASLGVIMLLEARIDLVPDRFSWLGALAFAQMLIGFYLVFQSRAR